MIPSFEGIGVKKHRKMYFTDRCQIPIFCIDLMRLRKIVESSRWQELECHRHVGHVIFWNKVDMAAVKERTSEQ